MTQTTQAPGAIPATTAQAPVPAERRLLKGGAQITEFIIKRKAEREDIRWFYGQAPNLGGVIWRLTEDGEFLSWTDELTEFLEAKATQAKANALAAAEAKAAEKEELRKAAREAAQPSLAKARKAPARKAAPSRQSQSEAVG